MKRLAIPDTGKEIWTAACGFAPFHQSNGAKPQAVI
jgi:hypothetical protein